MKSLRHAFALPFAATFQTLLLPCALMAAFVVSCSTQPDEADDFPARQAQRLSAAAGSLAPLNTSIRRLRNTVEVEVTADKPFRFNSLPAALVVGTQVFLRSRNPPDGRLTTLIFSIDSQDFDALPDAAEINVGYLSSGARLTVEGGRPPRASVAQLQPTRARAGVLEKASLRVEQ